MPKKRSEPATTDSGLPAVHEPQEGADDSREGWLDRRRDYIGASDAPAIIGCDPFRTAEEVFYQKRDGFEYEVESDKQSDSARFGHLVEGVLIDFCLEELEEKFGAPQEVNRQVERFGANGFTIAHLDGLAQFGDQWINIQAKATTRAEEWETAAGMNAPEHVIVQVQHEMYCAPEVTVTYVPVLTSNFGFNLQLIPIFPDPENIAIIMGLESQFWGMVESGTKPVNMPPVKLYERIKKRSGTRKLDPEIWESYQSLGEQIRQLEEERKGFRHVLMHLAGDHEFLDYGGEKIAKLSRSQRTTYGQGKGYNKDVCPHCHIGKKVSESTGIREVKRPKE